MLSTYWFSEMNPCLRSAAPENGYSRIVCALKLELVDEHRFRNGVVVLRCPWLIRSPLTRHRCGFRSGVDGCSRRWTGDSWS